VRVVSTARVEEKVNRLDVGPEVVEKVKRVGKSVVNGMPAILLDGQKNSGVMRHLGNLWRCISEEFGYLLSSTVCSSNFLYDRLR